MSAENGAVGVGSAMEASRSRERSLSEADGRETEGRRTMVGRREGPVAVQLLSSGREERLPGECSHQEGGLPSLEWQ